MGLCTGVSRMGIPRKESLAFPVFLVSHVIIWGEARNWSAGALYVGRDPGWSTVTEDEGPAEG